MDHQPRAEAKRATTTRLEGEQATRLATEHAADLLAELRSLGYNMQVIKRLNQQAYLDARRAELARMRA